MVCSAIDRNIHRDIAMHRHRTSRDILNTNSEPYRRANTLTVLDIYAGKKEWQVLLQLYNLVYHCLRLTGNLWVGKTNAANTVPQIDNCSHFCEFIPQIACMQGSKYVSIIKFSQQSICCTKGWSASSWCAQLQPYDPFIHHRWHSCGVWFFSRWWIADYTGSM